MKSKQSGASVGLVVAAGAMFLLAEFVNLEAVREFLLTPGRALEATVWMLLTALFIISRKRGVEAVKLREKLLKGRQLELAFQERALNEHSTIVTTDPHGNVMSVNPNFTDASGFSEDEMRGLPYRNSFFDRHDKCFEEIMRKARSGEIWNGDIHLLKKDGSVAILRSTVVPMSDQQGRHNKNIFISTDVTRERISEEERQLIKCLQLLPEDIHMFDFETQNILYMNDSAVHRLGWKENTYLKRNIRDVSSDIDEELLQRFIEKLAGRTGISIRFDIDCKGTPMEANVQIIETADRQRKYVSVLRDISERRAAEEARKSFVSMMTHELRTPLTSIKGALRLLTAGTAGTVEKSVLSMLEIAENNSDRLLGLVDDILDLEKIEAGKMDFKMESIDVRDLVAEALQNYRTYGSRLGVEFKSNSLAEPAMIDGDRNRLLQVMANLMSNAAKFSEPGGVVRIGIVRGEDSVRLSVSDDGPGIPDEARATLFEPFTQLDKQTSTKLNGTGLGLTIVKAIVERHEGSIDFRSELGKGTTFFFDLPSCEPQKIRSDIDVVEAA